MYPQSPQNEKEEYLSEATTPSEQTPPSYPSPHPKEFDFQPGPPPHHHHFGPHGHYNPYFATSKDFGYGHGGYVDCPPPPPPHHLGHQPHPHDPFFFAGKHHKKPKRKLMKKLMLATGVAFGGYVVFTMGRGYQFTMMHEAEMHNGIPPHHRGPPHRHHDFGEGMHRGNGSHPKFDHPGNHHGDETRPDFKPDFKPLDDSNGPPPFPEFGKPHDGEIHKGPGGPHGPNRKGPKGPKGAKGKHHKKPQGDDGEHSDDSDVEDDFKKERKPHGDDHREPDGPVAKTHKRAEDKKEVKNM